MQQIAWVLGVFDYPHRLWWLIAVPIGLAWMWIAVRKSRAWWNTAAAEEAPVARTRFDSRWLAVNSVGCAALVLIIIALAAPRSERGRTTGIWSNLQVVCLLDRSRSMLAEDVDGSRLELSRNLIRSTIARAPGAAVAVVSFAGRAEIDVPLTRDIHVLQRRLARITPNQSDLHGSNLADGWRLATQCFAERMDSNKLLLIFTDGETHHGPSEFQDQLPALEPLPPKTRVSIVCVGNAQSGSRIPLELEPNGSRQFLKFEGELALSTANPERMRKLADQVGGEFTHVTAASNSSGGPVTAWEAETTSPAMPPSVQALPFDRQLNSTLRSFEKQLETVLDGLAAGSRRRVVRAGQPGFPIFLRAAIVLLLIGTVLPMVPDRWFQLGRPRLLATTAGLTLFAVGIGAGSSPRSVSMREQIQRYNQGVVAYRSGAYDQAQAAFSQAATARIAKLRYPAIFNLANATVHSATRRDVSQAPAEIRQAIELYRQCLRAGYRSRDARANIQVAFALLQQKPQDPAGGDSQRSEQSGSDQAASQSAGGSGADPPSAGQNGSEGSARGSGTSIEEDLARPLPSSAAEEILKAIREREWSNPARRDRGPTPPPASPVLVGKPW